jgi:hypothetical protein
VFLRKIRPVALAPAVNAPTSQRIHRRGKVVRATERNDICGAPDRGVGLHQSIPCRIVDPRGLGYSDGTRRR